MAADMNDRLGNYQSVKQIGKGSYGEVFLVRKKRDKKQFVMKNIKLSSGDVKERHAATQEAELLSQLKHPNIVSYHESFQDSDGVLHIVMGYCEGGDLCTRLKGLKGAILGEDKVVEWFVQIALALQYLHERKIMHRDLKTQNIFLSKHDIIKVGDLGIARVLDGSLDLAHTIVGTPYYMSPELFANKPYDYKSDVWALGCCVYEMASLNHAFSAKNISALMYKILQGKVPPLPSCFSSNLNSLVCKMLSLEASERPSVYQILRTDFIRVHIKQFLDKATTKRKKPSSASSKPDGETPPTVNEPRKPIINGAKNQKRPLPPLVAQPIKSDLLKPIQLSEKPPKPSPELSSAREKRRRSKQLEGGGGGRGRVVIRSHSSGSRGSPSSLPTKVDEQDGSSGGSSSKENDDEQAAVLSIMDTTLQHIPSATVITTEEEQHKQPTTDEVDGAKGRINPQIEAIKRHCVAVIGEDGVSKALEMLYHSNEDNTALQDQLKVIIGPDKYTSDLLVMLQKLRLYLKSV